MENEYQKVTENKFELENSIGKSSSYFIRSSLNEFEIINPRLDNQLSTLKWIIFFPFFLFFSPFIFLYLIVQVFCIKEINPTRIIIKKDTINNCFVIKKKINLSCYRCYSSFTKKPSFLEVKKFIFKKDGDINDTSSPYNGIRGGIYYENLEKEMVKLIDILGIPKDESEYIINILNSLIDDSKIKV